ncbi:hypothetical protein HFP89_14905 [Wenzhouxiangella sp. XN79A]|uniref:hypothetical protein n=1 Tax=Wenzhouxiangella sp. XN79A TaxID=2724193 RepID=UPI00144AB986|nr:hypothetical protein [Wenzhouxiangella sp. XN79A]NKI36457.1 hypothetical protein [Wenzhouxiangella sp. XN79A]
MRTSIQSFMNIEFFLAALVLAAGSQNVMAQQVDLSSQLDEHSVVANAAAETVVYELVDDWGGVQDVEVDLGSEMWMVTTSDGEILAGSIPQAALDEYYAQGVPLPCFSSPWAAAGCSVGGFVAALVCEVRASANIRRLRNACNSQGMTFSLNGVSGCGNVSGHCFHPNHHLQTP